MFDLDSATSGEPWHVELAHDTEFVVQASESVDTPFAWTFPATIDPASTCVHVEDATYGGFQTGVARVLLKTVSEDCDGQIELPKSDGSGSEHISVKVGISGGGSTNPDPTQDDVFHVDDSVLSYRITFNMGEQVTLREDKSETASDFFWAAPDVTTDNTCIMLVNQDVTSTYREFTLEAKAPECRFSIAR